MKPNIFQKILSLIVLSLIVICFIFYVPKRNNDEVYDVILLCILTGFFYVLYRYLNKMTDLSESEYKKYARNEMVVFIVYISGILLSFLFLISSNGINHFREQAISIDIENINKLISEKYFDTEVKRINRKNFWDLNVSDYERAEYNNDINNFWNDLVFMKEKTYDLDMYLSYFNSIMWNQFKNRDDLKLFIEKNMYNNEDISNLKSIKKLNSEINLLIEKKGNLRFFGRHKIEEITLTCFYILFGILYLLRPLILFIKGIFIELK